MSSFPMTIHHSSEPKTVKQAYEIFKSYDGNIPKNFLEKVISNPNDLMFMTSIQLENNDNLLPVIKITIGKAGFYLMKTTDVNDVDFIWYNKSSHSFEVWGSQKDNIQRAVTVLQKRLQSKFNQIFNNTTSYLDQDPINKDKESKAEPEAQPEFEPNSVDEEHVIITDSDIH